MELPATSCNRTLYYCLIETLKCNQRQFFDYIKLKPIHEVLNKIYLLKYV